MSSSEDATIDRILRESKTIAVVGMSDDRSRPTFFVPAYLKSAGYKIIPVNPKLDEVIGLKAYASLSDIPEPVDVVQLIVRGDRTPPFVEEAIAIGAKAIWMQLGISNEEAAATAREAGLDVVMNRCMMVEHKHRSPNF